MPHLRSDKKMGGNAVALELLKLAKLILTNSILFHDTLQSLYDYILFPYYVSIEHMHE